MLKSAYSIAPVALIANEHRLLASGLPEPSGPFILVWQIQAFWGSEKITEQVTNVSVALATIY